MEAGSDHLIELYAQLRSDARRVRQGARALARESTLNKNDALLKMAQALRHARAPILAANVQDLDAARARDLDRAFVERLTLSPEAIEAMARALEEIATLPDPVGGMDRVWRRPNGLEVGKKRIPLGVIGFIYESRPNVTSDAVGLCLKSGNGVMLKGGSDAFESNGAIFRALEAGLRASALSPGAQDAIGMVSTTHREAVREMLTLDRDIDLIIPRGGKGLIDFVQTHSRIPVIKHDQGVCHLVIEGSAKPEHVDAIVLNAKTQRPGVCNAIETLLVLDNAVDFHLARVLGLLAGANVKLHLCERSVEVARAAGLSPECFRPATDADYEAEYLALEIAVRVVPELAHAIDHIDQFGSRHTESLLTQNYSLSQQFVDQIDSSVVMINASTRFSDGNQLGLGAEIGISTTRMHAYGPMGLEELTTTKFVVLGDGQIRP